MMENGVVMVHELQERGRWRGSGSHPAGGQVRRKFFFPDFETILVVGQVTLPRRMGCTGRAPDTGVLLIHMSNTKLEKCLKCCNLQLSRDDSDRPRRPGCCKAGQKLSPCPSWAFSIKIQGVILLNFIIILIQRLGTCRRGWEPGRQRDS